MIISHCDLGDLWLSLRNVNHQTKRCAEEHFGHEILHHVTLKFRYYMNARCGEMVFRLIRRQPRPSRTSISNHVDYVMADVNSYLESTRSNLLARWNAMRRSGNSHLVEQSKWKMRLFEHAADVCLESAVIVKDPEDIELEARVSFEWRPMMTAFFKAKYEDLSDASRSCSSCPLRIKAMNLRTLPQHVLDSRCWLTDMPVANCKFFRSTLSSS